MQYETCEQLSLFMLVGVLILTCCHYYSSLGHCHGVGIKGGQNITDDSAASKVLMEVDSSHRRPNEKGKVPSSGYVMQSMCSFRSPFCNGLCIHLNHLFRCTLSLSAVIKNWNISN